MIFPDRDPLYIEWLRWCWRKPVYIGFPLVFAVFLIVFADLFYLIYWWITRWGSKREL